MVITVKESKKKSLKKKITVLATHLQTHMYKRLIFTFFFNPPPIRSASISQRFQKSTTYNEFRVSPLVM